MKKIVEIVAGVLIASMAVVSVVLAWSEPTAAPVGTNINAPINTGAVQQNKTGDLGIGTGLPYWVTKNFDSFALKNNAGTIKFILGQDGNTGIGTTGPAAKLHIVGSSQNTLAIDSPAYPELTLRTSGTIKSYDAIVTTAGGYLTGSAVGDRIIRTETGSILLGYSTTPTLKVSSAGTVGIGTVSPGYKLHVIGDIYANGGWLRTSGGAGWISETYGGGWYMSDTSWIRSYGGKNIWLGAGLLGSDGGLTVGYGGAASPSGGAIIMGNVGVGTASPNAKLNVVGATNLSRDNVSECCGGDFTLSLAEATSGTGKKAGIQFHNSGVSEGQLRLDAGTNGRELKAYSYQTDMDLHATGYVQGDQGLCMGTDCRASWASVTGASVSYSTLTGIPTRTAWNGIHRGFVA